MLGGPTRTYAWIPDRGATGFDGAEEFRRAHLWIERLGRSMDRVVIVASRVDLDAVAPMDPVDLGYQVATRRVHVAVRHPTDDLCVRFWTDP